MAETNNNRDEDVKKKKLHIAIFPWLAFGHLIPNLELAKLIAQKGHKISFISTQTNIDRLKLTHSHYSHLIHFVQLPFPTLSNLPNHAQSTSDVAFHEIPILKQAYDLLRNPISHFLQSSKPDWLFCDIIADWLPDISRVFGVKTVFFSIITASSLGYIGAEVEDYRNTPEEFSVPPKWVPYKSTVAYRRFEVNMFYDETVNDCRSVFRRIAAVARGCDVVAVRSCPEFEREALTFLPEYYGKPVFPVGQLPPEIGPEEEEEETNTWRSSPIKKWLDDRESGSVVYVAFGSESEWSQKDLTEIALGLEISNFPFLWVMRAGVGSGCLPDGFEERVGGRGYICRGWVSQVKILAHDSIGVFMNHSGWSSVVESLRFSRPLVLLAFANDQGLNLKTFEERFVGYPVPRDENDGSFTRESVAESLKMVVKDEKGKIYREKAKEVSKIFGDGLVQQKYVDEFVEYLENYTNQN